MPRSIFSRFLRPPYSMTTASLLTAFFIVIFDNQSFWRNFSARLGTNSLEHWLLLLTFGMIFVLLLHIIFTLVSYRPLFKPCLIAFLLVAAVVSYFTDSFGVIIDKSMINNVLETDVREASELISLPLLWHLLLLGLLPAALVAAAPLRYPALRRGLLIRTVSIAVSLVLIGGLAMAEYKQLSLFGRANRDLRMFLNPTYAIYSVTRVLRTQSVAEAEQPLKIVAEDAVREVKAGQGSVVVLAIGETARAQELYFNGYQRDTNPYLRRHEVISFSDVESCGTATAESLPCMFSSLGRDDFSRDKAKRMENVLDILHRTGVGVVWRDNDSGSKGVAERLPYEDFSHRQVADLCVEDSCYDEVLLLGVDQLIRDTSGDLLIVLHLKGSHGPSYYKRSPPGLKTFLPECTQDNVQDCPQQTIINAYDNTIVYTDYVLAKLVDLLKEQDARTALLYVSDHGESLGENGIYLHGLPFVLAPEEQTHVPMIFWASENFLLDQRIDPDDLQALKNAPLSHDNLFHTLLGLFHVRTGVYQRDLDFFSGIRQKHS